MKRLLAIASTGLILIVATFSLPAVARAAASYAFATCTEFSGPGCGSWVGLDPPRTAHACVANLSSDPVARWAFGKIYVVNRLFADNIQVLDPSNGFQSDPEHSVGNGTNPQDIAVLTPTKAYVSLLNAPYLLVFDPASGTALDSIPLGSFADSDGIPEAAKMLIYGDRVFVALQRLDNFVPTAFSLVAVIDANADTVVDVDPVTPGVQAIPLTGTNPNTDLVFDPSTGHILVGEVGSFAALDGGVDVIDPGTLHSLGYEATETSLGGNIGDIAVSSQGKAYAALTDLAFEGGSRLVRYDRATGIPNRTLLSTANYSVGEIETNDRNELWVCDRSTSSPGLRAYGTLGDTLLAGPISTDLPPFDVLFDAADVAGVSPGPRDAGIRIVSLGPNPNRGEWELRFQVGEGPALATRLRVFDARGGIVGDVDLGVTTPGPNRASWRAGSGTRAGTYFFRLDRGGQTASGRFTMLR
jgi:DNA-binding beta-propeller fold protein YncE